MEVPPISRTASACIAAQSLSGYTPLADYSKLGLTTAPHVIPADAYALDLSGNYLTRLPSNFGFAHATLQTLDISNNRLEELPEDICRMPCLRELYVDHNLLSQLPNSLGSLQNLEILSIANNNIATLKPSVAQLKALRVLNISHNEFVQLPACLGLLVETLQLLVVDGNPLDRAHQSLVEPLLTPKQTGPNPRMTRTHTYSLQTKEYVSGIKRFMRWKRHSTSNYPTLLTVDTKRDSINFAATWKSHPPAKIGEAEMSLTTAVLPMEQEDAGQSSSSSTSRKSCLFSSSSGTDLIRHMTSSVLWQLRDEWDLDPAHGDATRELLGMHTEKYSSVRESTALDHAYHAKAATAGNSQRMKILSELLVTEVTYVDTLKNVVGVYLNPMREAKILSESELRKIFLNIEVILAFHNDHFLPAITHAISQPEMLIADVFLRHSAHFRLYSVYTNGHETSVQTLFRVSSRRTVSNFIQSARQDVTQIGQVSLDGHLLTPIQRLPRYRMLLADLLHNTPANHTDHESLVAALKSLDSIIYEVNEKKREFEQQTRLRQLQSSILGAAEIPLVAPHRRFCLAGALYLKQHCKMVVRKNNVVKFKRASPNCNFWFCLFNDLLLQCVAGVNKDFKIVDTHKLDTCIAPARIISDTEMRIIGSDTVLYIKEDADTLRKWAHAINHRLVI
ncbi:hypothetical protein IWW40_004956 [Coemansia sp. RSA 1250]|nr:hypothetical protein IWW40_004956 [Coemansia sp. RSA 1250]